MTEVVSIEKTPENVDVLKHAQHGDMIEFTRGLYSHWAIYVGKDILVWKRFVCLISIDSGDGHVIHRWGDHDGIGRSVGFLGNLLTFSGTQFDKATILQSKVCDVMKFGGEVKVNNYLDNKYKYVNDFFIRYFLWIFREKSD